MAHLFESGVFGKNVPAWHNLGKVVAGTFSLDEAMEMGDLDWQVEKRPIYIRDKHFNEVQVPGFYSVVRTSDDSPLGRPVGEEYQCIQNREAFQFLENVLRDKTCRWEAAISIRGGAMVAGIISLPDSGVEIVKGDSHYLYLAVITAHDGSSADKVFPTDVRIVCANTVQAAINGRPKGLTVNIRHSGDISKKLTSAEEIIWKATSDYKRFAEWQQHLAQIEATNTEIDEFVNGLFAAADVSSKRSVTMRANKVDAFHGSLMEEAEISLQSQPTAYTLLNAGTRYIDHFVSAKKDNTAEYAMVGGGNDTKNKMVGLISDIFAVPLPQVASGY